MVCFHCLRKYCREKKSIDIKDQYCNVFICVIHSIIWDNIIYSLGHNFPNLKVLSCISRIKIEWLLTVNYIMHQFQ